MELWIRGGRGIGGGGSCGQVTNEQAHERGKEGEGATGGRDQLLTTWEGGAGGVVAREWTGGLAYRMQRSRGKNDGAPLGRSLSERWPTEWGRL